MTDNDQELPQQQQQAQDNRHRCSTCAAFPKLTHRFLDPKQGKTVRLYECHCCERMEGLRPPQLAASFIWRGREFDPLTAYLPSVSSRFLPRA
jgi:hypothetical protein